MKGIVVGGIWRASKWGARVVTRAGRALRLMWQEGKNWRQPPALDVMGASLDVEEGRPRANLADWLDGQPAEVVADMRELATAYARTFCGQCKASPERPSVRCGRCLELLVAVIDGRNGEEARKLSDVARALARGGRF